MQDIGYGCWWVSLSLLRSERLTGHDLRRVQALAALSVVIPLTDPDLRDELGVDRWQGRMQGSRIEMPIHGCRKEYQGRSLGGLDFQGFLAADALDQLRKGRVASAGNVVQVNQDRHRPLAPVGRETGPILLVGVESIKVRHVLLAIEVSSNLWEFHVANGLVGELGDLSAEPGKVFSGQIAGGRCSSLADNPGTSANDGCRRKRIGSYRNEVIAFFGREKVLYLVHGWVTINLLEAGVKRINSIEDRDWSRLLLLALRLLVLRILNLRLLLWRL